MKLSCVVPILNEEDNVKDFLKGYITQTQKFHELIFVDGNSKDKTREIIKEYMKKNKEIKLVMCDRKGPAAARNEGLDNATGDYVTFMDADYTFGNSIVIEKIIKNIRNDEVYIFKINPSNKKEKISLKKYMLILESNPYFKLYVVKKDLCPRWDEELGFGEDRMWRKECRKNNYKEIYVDEKEIALSKKENNLNLKLYLRRTMWYGRTMYPYVKKTKDTKDVMRLIFYVVGGIPIFWFMPFLWGFFKGLKYIEYGYDTPFGIGLIFIINSIGTLIGFVQFLIGIKHVGRDKV